jgi:hypothetical protein
MIHATKQVTATQDSAAHYLQFLVYYRNINVMTLTYFKIFNHLIIFQDLV